MNSQPNSAVLRAWMHRALREELPLGMSANESLAIAREILTRSTDALRADVVDRPDVLHALVCLLMHLDEGEQVKSLPVATAAYNLITDGLEGLPDREEAQSLAGAFAYVAWSICRRLGRSPETRRWEQRCDFHATEQESTRDFLGLPLSEQSTFLRDRFLSDRTTMLAFCHQVAIRRNREPARAEADARLAYHWLVNEEMRFAKEEHAYFAGQLALCAAVACKHLGRLRDAAGWAVFSEGWFRESADADISLARLDLFLAILHFDRHLPQKALERIPMVLARLKKFGLAEEYHRGRFLEAVALKSAGRVDEAMDRLVTLSRDFEVHGDPMVHGLVMINLAELQAKRGPLDRSLELFDEAVPILKEAVCLGGWPTSSRQWAKCYEIPGGSTTPSARTGLRSQSWITSGWMVGPPIFG